MVIPPEKVDGAVVAGYPGVVGEAIGFLDSVERRPDPRGDVVAVYVACLRRGGGDGGETGWWVGFRDEQQRALDTVDVAAGLYGITLALLIRVTLSAAYFHQSDL